MQASVLLMLIVCATLVALEREICPDRSSCHKEKERCCPRKDGYYFCCYYPQGTCCDDGISCCPSNSVCQGDDLCSNWLYSKRRFIQ